MLYKLHIILSISLCEKSIYKISRYTAYIECIQCTLCAYIYIYIFTLNSPAVMYTCLVPNISWLVYNHMHVRACFGKYLALLFLIYIFVRGLLKFLMVGCGHRLYYNYFNCMTSATFQLIILSIFYIDGYFFIHLADTMDI